MNNNKVLATIYACADKHLCEGVKRHHNFSLNEYRDTSIANNFWRGMDEAF